MRVEPAGALVGHIAVPGDKSISHRALLVGALCEGETLVNGWGRSADTESTLAAVRALGARVEERDADTLVIHGRGVHGLGPPGEPIDCGNAGTLLRLLAGVVAGQEGSFTLTGDASLRSRPVERVAAPLRQMGARTESENGLPPLTIEGGSLQGITYELPVASAQVKSCVLLAGALARGGTTTVLEPIATRDHTELMLAAAGASVVRRPKSVSIDPARRLELGQVDVPGDFSSAAPFIVAATLLPGSELHVHGLSVNPRRIGLLDALERMGGRVTAYNRRKVAGEQVADLEIRSAELTATAIAPEEVPGLVDELPLFSLLAACARGPSDVRGAQELRLKESDRIEAVVTTMKALGAHIQERPDGFRVRGVPTRPRGGAMDACGDHRIAMLGAITGLVSGEGVEVGDAECVAVSFPGFFELIDSLVNQ